MPDLVTVVQLENLPGFDNLVGFVYRITDRLTGKFYVGMKTVQSVRKSKASQKAKDAALALNPRSRISVVRKRTQTDWLTYWGSCADLHQDVALHGPQRFVREIIDVCCSKKYLSFSELEQIIKHDCLRKDASVCYNGNLLSKYYRRDVQNCPEPNEN